MYIKEIGLPHFMLCNSQILNAKFLKEHKSFIRKSTNQNYTEPHHLIPMAYSDKFKVSLDVEANIVSLCSTCHNHIHYGVGAKDLLTSLYYQRINRLRAVGLDISLEELLQMYNII